MEDKLVVFLYTLMRDHLPCGTVESIMQNHVGRVEQHSHDFSKGRKCARCNMDSQDSMGSFCNMGVKFSNTHLEAYARDLVFRLTS